MYGEDLPQEERGALGGVRVQLEGIKAAPHYPSLCFLGVWLIERGASTEPVVETVPLTHVDQRSVHSPRGNVSVGVQRGTVLRGRSTGPGLGVYMGVLGVYTGVLGRL